jgi:galactitol-specific phosphotransferase system IIB component
MLLQMSLRQSTSKKSKKLQMAQVQATIRQTRAQGTDITIYLEDVDLVVVLVLIKGKYIMEEAMRHKELYQQFLIVIREMRLRQVSRLSSNLWHQG